MKHNINLLVSRYYDMEGGLCEQRPFFYGIDTVTDFSYVNCSNINQCRKNHAVLRLF